MVEQAATPELLTLFNAEASLISVSSKRRFPAPRGGEEGMGMTIIRPSHTDGLGGGIINNLNTAPTFLARLRHGRPIVVRGDGHGL